MGKEKLRIRAFRAVDDFHGCQKFVKGHMEVLTRFGITMITTANIDWFINPNVIVIVVESINGKFMYGGMRLHIKEHNTTLPIEDAVGQIDKSIYGLVDDHFEFGTGEFCGMWNSKEISGKGVSYLLTSAGTAVLSQLNVSTMFVLCAAYTVHMVERVGFNVLKQLGDNGTFDYPKLNLVATALVKKYNDFSTADIKEKILIQSLRQNPHQEKELTPFKKNESLSIVFDLELPPLEEKFLKNSA